jgi:hypothetical protein
MDQFDRGSRQREAEKRATDRHRGYGPPKRARGGVGLGLLLLVLLVMAAVFFDSGCSALTEVITGEPRMEDVDGLCVELKLSTSDGQDMSDEDLDQASSTIEHLIVDAGVAEPIVRIRDRGRIEVALSGIEPGTADSELLLGLVSTAGVLEFTPVPPVLQGAVLQDLPLRYLCDPGIAIKLPSVMWTDESLLLGGRITGSEHDLSELFRRWQLGTYEVDRY